MEGNPVTRLVIEMAAQGLYLGPSVTQKPPRLNQVESLGPPIKFRKLNRALAALEIQVEDGKFQKHAVARLCEAILATAELYTIDEDRESTLEELARSVIDLVER